MKENHHTQSDEATSCGAGVKAKSNNARVQTEEECVVISYQNLKEVAEIMKLSKTASLRSDLLHGRTLNNNIHCMS